MTTERLDGTEINENKIVNQIRCLGIDMIDAAQSGHPGIVLGAAPIIYSLYAHHIMITPENPDFFGRDRFIMSAGHGSALLYATLAIAGYDISLEDLKQFRQIDSKTPGHPEYKKTPGVDMTTGPLGQGIASAVGIALGEANLRTRYKNLINFKTYCLCSDGDLMEGVSYEAISLAGTLKLNNLILLYDSNDMSLDGETKLTFTENIPDRFKSMNWNVITVVDGENIESISAAIEEAKASKDKPTLIEVKTKIGKYSMLEGTNDVHGGPLTKEDITNIKETFKMRDIPFTVSQDVLDDFKYLINERCKDLEKNFIKEYENLTLDEQTEINYFIQEDKSIGTKDLIYEPPIDSTFEAVKITSSKILNAIVPKHPYMIGGSADLYRANKTMIESEEPLSADNYLGKNIYYGVREHAMGAISNGLALCGFRPYCSTFLSFSDYLKPSLRMACMMNLPVIYIFTHDSISVGEDGPTHQPVEQLLALRTMPNLDVFRPADANEVIGTYKTILNKKEGPAAIIISRNTLPILDTAKVTEVEKGGYIIFDTIRKPDGIIIATGEEVSLAIEIAKKQRTKGIEVRVVSMPNIKRFLSQEDEYKESVLPVEVRKLVIEAASSYSWNEIIFNSKYIIALDEFGASGKKDDVMKKYGFDLETLEEKVENLLK